jgi:hypothetical protein
MKEHGIALIGVDILHNTFIVQLNDVKYICNYYLN